MKKPKFLFLLLFALFLPTSGRCFSQEVTTTFADQHACDFSSGPRAGRCQVQPGESLSGIVHAVEHSWGKFHNQFLKDNPQYAKNPNLVRAGDWVYFSNLSVCNGLKSVVYRKPHEHAAHKTTATAFAPPQLDTLRHAMIAMDVPSDPTFTMDSSADEFAQAMFVSEHYQVTLAAPEIAQAQPAPLAKPLTPKPVIQHKKLTGYMLVANGNLKGPLQTQLLLFDNDQEKKDMVPADRVDLKDAWATPDGKGKTIIFVPLKKVPTQPFSFVIGGVNMVNGRSQPIDGNLAQHYAGKIPRQREVMAMVAKGALTFGISMLGSGGNLPLAAGMVIAPSAIHLTKKWVHEAHERRSLARQKAVDKAQLAHYRAQERLDSILSGGQ